MRKLLACAAILAGGMLAMSAGSASAFVQGPSAAPASMIEQVQCRTVRERVVHRNGRVSYRTVRRCSDWRRPAVRRCHNVRQRVVQPNGRVVYRTVRRCR